MSKEKTQNRKRIAMSFSPHNPLHVKALEKIENRKEDLDSITSYLSKAVLAYKEGRPSSPLQNNDEILRELREIKDLLLNSPKVDINSLELYPVETESDELSEEDKNTILDGLKMFG